MPDVAARMASRDEYAGRHQRHRPEQNLLYQIVDELYPAFAALMAEQGRELLLMCNRNSKNFSNAGGWNMAFFGFAASPATPGIGLHLAANEEGSARAAVHDAWPKAQPCL